MLLLRLSKGLLAGLFAVLAAIACAQLLPIPPVAYVTDQAGLLSGEQKQSLEQKLSNFEKQTGSQVAVIIVPSLNGEPIEDYAHRVGANWKLGRKGIGDGLLFIVSLKDRRARIDVMRDLEGAIPDVTAYQILNTAVLPQFKQDRYYQGINAGLDQIFARIKGENLPAPSAVERRPFDGQGALWDEPWIAIGFISFVFAMMMRELLGRKSAPISGLFAGGLAWFILQSVIGGVICGVAIAIIAAVFPAKILEAGTKHSQRIYRVNRRYRASRGFPSTGGFYGGFGGGGDVGGIGGIGGGSGSGGGGDAAGGGASGSW